MMNSIISKVGYFAFAILLLTNIAVASLPIRLKSQTIQADVKSNFSQAEAGKNALYLIQWKEKITEDEKNEIQNIGFKILDYVPENTLLVEGNQQAVSSATELTFIDRVFSYSATMKIDRELARQSILGKEAFIPVLLEFSASPKGINRNEMKGYFRGDVATYGPGTLIGNISVAMLAQIVKREDVLWVERYQAPKLFSLSAADLGVEINNTNTFADPPAYTGYESGTKVMNIDPAYQQGFNGKGMIVAYADTGLDTGDMNTLSKDFQGQIAAAYAIALGGNSWADPQSHGTHVAGSIASTGVNSQGKIRGAAWGAKLFVEGMWSDIMNNIFPPSTDALFTKAYDGGARIHSNSWGRDAAGAYDAMARSVDKFLFEHQDFLAVFAAGNSGADKDRNGVVDEKSLGTPATAKNVMTVGASKNYLLEGGIQKMMKELRDGTTKWGVEPLASSRLSEDTRGMAAFSSRGPTVDGRIKPDIVAPGTNIVSSRSHHPSAEIGWSVYDDNYLYMGGTSMATPLASGVLAILRQYLVAKLQTSQVSAALLKAFAINSAEDLYPGQFGIRAQGQEQPSPRPNNHEGFGRLHVAEAVANQSGNYEFVDEKQGLATGESLTKSIEVSANGLVGRPFRITMVYTDAVPANSAAKALVNDLDLKLTTPDGQVVYPNRLSAKDSTNNVEHIDVLTPKPGTYSLQVSGANIPMGINGKQPFALVIFR